MFACIFAPNFPMAAVFRAEPELRARPLAIFEGKPPLEKVFAVNDSAGRVGIAPGMTKAQAELCSELTLRPRSLVQESAAHAALLDCAQSFSPRVESAAADTAILDLAGMESLFGAPPEIAHDLFRCAASLGLDVNVAVASNPDAAVLAARGFSGVTVILSGKEAECLGPLPIKVLFADQPGEQPSDNEKKGKEKKSDQKKEAGRLLETLERWGVRDLRALAALPEVALSERLGQEGLRLRELAQGAASRTLMPVEAPAVFEETIELEFPIVLLEPLAFLLNRLLDQICARLAARALSTQELRLTLELQNLAGVDPQFDTFGIPSESDAASSATQSPAQHYFSGRQGKFCRILRLPLPMLDAKLFLKLLQLDLNAHPPGAPIVKIHLVAEAARPRSAQGGLFLPPSPEPEKLELTLARIAGLVGESRVGSVELLDTHRAEGFRLRRFVPRIVQGTHAQKPSEPEKEKSAVAALRMFRSRLRATVIFENGELARVSCTKKKEVQGSVLWKAGPWRSSGDWWEREAWARDEWDIALQNADGVVLYRLVHDLLGGGWFVEGTYD
ncbi:MAG: DNA polymerase Y family protein [Candidatus Sulfotelmatobacter sp.]